MAQNVVPMRANYQRQLRTPQHRFHVRHEPFTIQPVAIAPVRAGDSLLNFNLQVRAVTDPINNPLIGWWLEHYVFYVRLTDLSIGDSMKTILTDPEASPTALHSALDYNYYHVGGSINYTKECLKAVVNEYFRLENETWDEVVDSQGMPVAAHVHSHWTDSLRDATTMDAMDFNIDTDASTTIEASEVAEAMEKWQLLQTHGLIDMSWEDYLGTFGVRTTRAESHVPELIRYTRNWQYPSNTVDPTDGSVASAVSWSIAERGDKRRFFREPGFIFAVSTARPKLYLARQSASLAHFMDKAQDWLPALTHPNLQSAYKRFDNAAAGPLSSMTNDYVIDLKDLFLHGDQFRNFQVLDGTAGAVALPTSDGNHRYPTLADPALDQLDLFVSASVSKIKQDGVFSFRINSDLKESSPTTTPATTYS